MLWPLLLELAEKTKLSDIHIHSDHGVAYREYGDMVQPMSHDEILFTSDSAWNCSETEMSSSSIVP